MVRVLKTQSVQSIGYILNQAISIEKVRRPILVVFLETPYKISISDVFQNFFVSLSDIDGLFFLDFFPLQTFSAVFPLFYPLESA